MLSHRVATEITSVWRMDEEGNILSFSCSISFISSIEVVKV